MTKEELEKEAIQYAVDYPTSYGKGYKHKDLRIAYLAGAEPREKQIQALGERCLQLQKDKGRLTDELIKSKEIIKDLCGMVRELNKPNVQLTNIDYSLSEAERFINEVEK